MLSNVVSISRLQSSASSIMLCVSTPVDRSTPLRRTLDSMKDCKKVLSRSSCLTDRYPSIGCSHVHATGKR